ncbi:MAG: DUF5803 family protein [Halobacteriaceae archaeon]
MKRVAALIVFAALFLTAGCLGTGGITQQDIDANASYNWSVNTTVRYNVTGDTFRAVTVITNGTPVEAYRITEFQGEQPVSVSAVRFRYPNGSVTTVNVSAVEQTGGRTIITPPADRGRLAYTAQSYSKEFSMGIGREGSYKVVLPPGMRIGIPLLGTISPGGADLRVVDNRVHLRWASLSDGEIALTYFLERDFWLFAALVGGLAVLAVIGVVYFRIQLNRLATRRREAGLNVDE